MSQEYRMPKCCISCGNYTHKGYANDEHSPFSSWENGARHNRVQYGTCAQHGTEVFATEICNTYESMPGITVVDVMNRPEPKEIRQERLF